MDVETAEISASCFDFINENIFRYHFSFCSVLFYQHCEQCKGSFEQKIYIKDSNLKESIEFRERFIRGVFSRTQSNICDGAFLWK